MALLQTDIQTLNIRLLHKRVHNGKITDNLMLS